jgi:hypothetical protein
MAVSPGQPQELKPEQTGSQSPPDQSKPLPEVAAPLATPVTSKPKTSAPPVAAAKPVKPPQKPEKAAPKPAVTPPEAKAAKPETGPQLVATLDKEIAARKKADALIKQGQRAIVKKAKTGDKTVYQVWIPGATTSQVKPAAAKPKAGAKANEVKPR